MMELRRDEVRHFGGSYRHRWCATADGLRIRLQRVDMMNGQAAVRLRAAGLGLSAATHTGSLECGPHDLHARIQLGGAGEMA